MGEQKQYHRLILAGDVDLSFRYAAIPVDTLQPSHVMEDGGLGPTVQPNRRYRGRVQGRVYSEVTLAGDAMESAARVPRVDFLLDLTATAAFGPPLCVHEKGQYKVVAGHQRAAILRYQFTKHAPTAFRTEYRALAAARFSDLLNSTSPADVVIIRVLTLPASVPDETLRAINRVSDAPLTKPRDTLAVVRGLSADVIDRGPLAAALLDCLPKNARAYTQVDSVQRDMFAPERTVDFVQSQVAAQPEPSSPHRFLSTLLRAIGDRIRDRYGPPLESLLFAETAWSRGDSSKPLTMPLLTQSDRLAFLQRSSQNRTELTGDAARNLAYLTLSILLGGSDRLERLAEVRALHFAQSRSTKRLPGALVLRKSTALVASADIKFMSSSQRRRLLDMLGRTLLAALANDAVVKTARRQLGLAGGASLDVSWCEEALNDSPASRSWNLLQSTPTAWRQFLIDHAQSAPALTDAVLNESDIQTAPSPKARQPSRDEIVELIADSLSVFCTKELQNPTHQARSGTGRPKVSEADLRFTMLVLLQHLRLTNQHATGPLLLQLFRQRGSERYVQLLGPISDLLGPTHGCAGLHHLLRDKLELIDVRLPRLVGARRLREAIAAHSPEALRATLLDLLV